MTRRHAIVTGLALTFFALAGCATGGAASDPQAMQRRIDRLEAELAETRLALAEARREAVRADASAAGTAPSADAAGPEVAASADLRAELEAERARRERAEAEARRLEQLAGLAPKDEDAPGGLQPRFNTIERPGGGETVVGPSVRINDTRGFLKLPHFLRVGFDRPAPGADASRVWGQLDAFGFPNRRYQGVDEIHFIVDGSERLSLPVTEFDVIDTRVFGAAKSRQRTYDLRVEFDIDSEALDRLASAQQIEMMVSNRTTPLDREHVALFLAVEKRVEGTR